MNISVFSLKNQHRWLYNLIMVTPILTTKLYIPPPPPKVVFRSRLLERLDAGLHQKLILISAPAGFGKTTLVSEWIANRGHPAAWLSLDENDNDVSRFLIYCIGALQTISQKLGTELLGTLQSSQIPPIETILTALLNEITAIPSEFILVLDDYHLTDAKTVDDALNFLIEHLPPQMHLEIISKGALGQSAEPKHGASQLKKRQIIFRLLLVTDQ